MDIACISISDSFIKICYKRGEVSGRKGKQKDSMDITYPQILVTENEIPTEILIISVTFLANNNLTKLIDPNFQKVRNKREMNNEENFKDIDKVPV